MPHGATGLDGVVRRDHARRGCRSRGEHVVLAGGRLHTEAGAEAAASGAARIPEPALRHQSAIAKSRGVGGGEGVILIPFQDETNNATLSSWQDHEEPMSSWSHPL